MKEATGELNLTVITVVAIAAVAAIFYAFVWPTLKVSIARRTCESDCGNTGNTCSSITKENIDSYAGDYSGLCTTTTTK